jgi:hypothetical protein
VYVVVFRHGEQFHSYSTSIIINIGKSGSKNSSSSGGGGGVGDDGDDYKKKKHHHHHSP